MIYKPEDDFHQTESGKFCGKGAIGMLSVVGVGTEKENKGGTPKE